MHRTPKILHSKPLILHFNKDGQRTFQFLGLLLLFSVMMVVLSQEKNNSSTNGSRRTGRLFNFFAVVRFNNNMCDGRDGRKGVCVPFTTCTRNGGTTNGNCAQGFGTCCMLENSCGSNITLNNTYFTNPGYPNPLTEALSCAVTVIKQSDNICQLRLDLEVFTLAGPTNGVCGFDAFSITGHTSSHPLPIICGVNSGQHMYVNVDNSVTPVTLLMTTSAGTQNRWKVRVSQVECNSPVLAPQECLQYHMDTVGVIKSFNYDGPTPEVLSGQANYMNGMNYAVCIRRAQGFCGVDYMPMEQGSFDMDDGAATRQESGTDNMCFNDYILIPGGINAAEAGVVPINLPEASKFCGNRLNAFPNAQFDHSAGVMSILPGVIQLFFVSDNKPPAPGSFDRGINLRYQQRPCAFLQGFKDLLNSFPNLQNEPITTPFPLPTGYYTPLPTYQSQPYSDDEGINAALEEDINTDPVPPDNDFTSAQRRPRM